ncbi:MAG: M23 family metallopeptidase [Nitriliruptorales bacterium]|nr:M23 family metallopeptidase [Nitriliruptorales bacterium]
MARTPNTDDDTLTRAEAARRQPVGVAPLAIEPPPKPGRRRRLLYAAIVSGTLISAPLASQAPATAAPRAHERFLDAALGPEERPVPPALQVRSDTQDASVEDRGARTAAPLLARVDGLEIVSPSKKTAMVGFHESFSASAAPLSPATEPQENHGAKPLPKIVEEEGSQAGIVLPTRNRPGGATSAVDIALPEGEDVLAPVSGEVVAVSPYFLYGQHPDVRIDIIPEGRPDLRVVIIHVADVTLEPGDVIEAGKTRIAGSAVLFPFESQIDRFVADVHGEAMPHVHIEVNHVS